MKTKENTEKQSKTTKRDVFENAVTCIAMPFFGIYYALYYIWMGIYMVFLHLPAKQSRIFGLFRATIFWLIVSNGTHLLRLEGEFKVINLFLGEFFGTVLILAMNAFWIYGGAISLLMMGGLNSGLRMEDNNSNVRFSNIKEAFDYRDEVLGQLSTTNKMKEMAKLGFMTNDRFQNPTSTNEAEGFENLHEHLGQFSSTGKYEEMQRLISGKK